LWRRRTGVFSRLAASRTATSRLSMTLWLHEEGLPYTRFHITRPYLCRPDDLSPNENSLDARIRVAAHRALSRDLVSLVHITHVRRYDPPRLRHPHPSLTLPPGADGARELDVRPGAVSL
jgi:hypothetical protein